MQLPAGFHEALEGRYEVDRLIGRGGMASVFLARDLKHDRQVALKVLSPELASAIGSDRFLTEIRVTARLQHPHLLPLFDSGEAAGLLYYVMPYVRGESLAARLRRSPRLPVEDAVRLAGAVAQALEHAHSAGVVHRDLKPENVLLQDGQPIVADFGIALAVSHAADARATQTGVVLGTPSYMSPEQAAGSREVDARTDVYALGALLYEMLAGRPPFVGDTALSVMAKILTERPVAVRVLRPDVPVALDAAVMRALAHEPGDRWRSAADFRLALERALPAADSVTAPVGIATDSESPTRAVSAAPAGRVPRRATLLAVAVLLVAAVAGAWYWSSGEAPPAAPVAAESGRPRSLAVLPFENRSPDAADEYFSDGLSEELQHQLAQTPGLRVAARASSFAFKGQSAEPSEVGRRLNVEAIVFGSVRRSGAAVRITAELVSAADGALIWSQQYEREIRDAFEVQDEIARAIVARVGSGSADATASSRGPDADGPGAEAFDLFLRGLYQRSRRTEEGALAAVDLFSKAVAIAPDYARAHGSLAESYAVLGFYDYMAPRQAFSLAREAAERALRLDPTLPEALSTLGYVALYHDWNVPEAEQAFRQAIAQSPRSAVAHQWYANALTAAGRFDEAAASMRTAQEMDPLAPIVHAALGWVFLYARDFEGAERQLRSTLESYPDYFLARLWLGEALEGQRRWPDALDAVDHALRASPGNLTAELVRLRILARSGRQDEARAGLARLQDLEQARYVPAYPRALVHVALDEPDEAFAMLERAVRDRAHAIAFLRIDPGLDPLRGDARFERVLASASPAPSR